MSRWINAAFIGSGAAPVALVLLSLSAHAQSVSANPSASGSFSAPGGLVISPKNGQSPQQQSADRFECHTWAMAQTGYDPTAMSAGTAVQKPKLAPYRRAMSACLEAKGYAVSVSEPAPPAYVAPMPPPPPPSPPPVASAPILVRQAPATPSLDYHPFHVQIDGGYSVTTGPTDRALDGGATAGLGFAWFPTSALPVGIRVDGSYNWFRAKDALLATTGADWGHEHVYGGDVDLQLDLAHRSTRSKLYLLGGVGWYRENTELVTFNPVSYPPASYPAGNMGAGCGWWHCGPGQFFVPTVENSTSPWHQSWNAGLGWEIAVADRSSFFIEARYERIRPYSGGLSFVPVTLGFRF